MNRRDLEVLARRCADIIRTAERDGVAIDDGSVVDLCADNTEASLCDIKAALVIARLSARFPRATVLCRGYSIPQPEAEGGAA
jgi:hypothetical protein